MRRDSHRPQVLDFVRDRIERLREAPTCKEAGDAVGISAVAAWKHFQGLIAEGELIKNPDGSVGLPEPVVNLTSVPTDRLRGELARRGVTFDALKEPALLQTEGRECAAYHCTTRVPRGRLMCREHWLGLPWQLRTAILNAWRARHMQAYQDAVEAARDYLGGFTKVVERVE